MCLQLAQQNIQWTFNPPLAPHFGGHWERLIQSAKRSLLVVLESRRLNFSVFHTVVAEAEGILNSRPLTHVGSTLINEEPLTPNHFLMTRRHFCPKPLANNRTGFSIKDFKESQTLLDHYWSRLLKEFRNLTEYRKLTDGQNGSKPTLSSRKTMLFGSTKILHLEEFGPLVGSSKHM